MLLSFLLSHKPKMNENVRNHYEYAGYTAGIAYGQIQVAIFESTLNYATVFFNDTATVSAFLVSVSFMIELLCLL